MIQSQADIVLADMQDPHVRGNSGARAIVDTTPLFVAKPKLSALMAALLAVFVHD